ncbi:MAG: ATP-binding protein, partial [Acidobacteriota bacterium]
RSDSRRREKKNERPPRMPAVSRLGRAWQRYHRENRVLIGAFVFLMLLSSGAFYLLERAREASPEEIANRVLLFVLWYLDISLILILSFVLLRNVLHLVVERRSGVLGSRFRIKLVLTYVGLTFVPVILIFLIATNLLQGSIDRWFSSPVETILRGGAEVTVQLRELMEEHLQTQAAVASEELERAHGREDLAHLQRLLGVDLVALYDGTDLVESVANPRRIPASLPPLRWENLPRNGVRADRWRGGLLLRAWSPLGKDGRVVVGNMLPRELLLHLENAIAADASFQEMKLQRGAITATTILVLLAITLLLLFASVWVGLFLSRRFTQPLLAVAAATRRVAEGNALEEVDAPASDEVAVLVDSFNAMVRRVRATEAEILTSNQELATLLATVPTGVLSVDADGSFFRPNPAAAKLLGDPDWMGRWLALDELDRPGLVALYRRLLPTEPESFHCELDLEPRGEVLHIDITSRPLPGGGRVIAMDDLTQLAQAQRQAAWSEVAQRIAHEIKNPLTPIQLAAERIQKRATALEGELGDIVTSGCEAIVSQVSGLKELVDAFREYARMPSIDPRPTAVGRILRELASLYSGLRQGVEVEVFLPEKDLQAMVDPVLLRQALVNLLDNAVDAIEGAGRIAVSARSSQGDVIIEVTDTGIGLPTDDTDTLLEPFFSTKGRGSGMGLALVHRIVADHGGVLELEPRSPSGTLVRVILKNAEVRDAAGTSAARGLH